MINKVSNKTLGMVFAAFLIIALAVIIFDSGSSERTLRTELVDIDTSKVSQIVIYPKSLNGEKINLHLDGDQWKVDLTEGKTANVPQDKIDNIFQRLMEVKPTRLAGRGEERWSEFEVDSSATRVEVYEGSKKTLDIVIGKFTFQQPRSMKTFVRLTDDTDVYETEGFLSMAFNLDTSDFRDPTLIKSKVENWKSVSYSYPADSSFQLVKLDNNWQLSNGMQLDSAKTETALRQLSNLIGMEFVDVTNQILPQPEYKLTIIKNDDSQIEVFGYKVDDKIIINSSQNPESYFDGSKNNLFKKVFVGLSKFTNE